MVSVGVVGPVTFPNGDVCDFLDIVFRCRHVSGEARVNDDESLAVGWFALDGAAGAAGPGTASASAGRCCRRHFVHYATGRKPPAARSCACGI